MEIIKKIGSRIVEVVFILAVLAIAIVPQCNNTKLNHPGVDTVYTSTTVTIDSTQRSIPTPVYLHTTETIPMPIPSVIDTDAVIAAYYSAHVITREWRDSDLVVNITDTLQLNQISGSLLTYKILRPCVSTTTVISKPEPQAKYHLFTGVGFGVGAPQLNVNALFTTPKYAYGISTNLLLKQPNAAISANIKLF